MRKVIASLDIGSESIKLIVGEFIGSRLYILCAIKEDNNTIDESKIFDKETFKEKVKKIIETASSNIGLEIKKVILGLNIPKLKLIKSQGATFVKGQNNVIDGEDVINVISNCSSDKVENGYALIETIPALFSIDNEVLVDEPKGKRSEKLYLKGIVATAPKDYISNYVKLIEEIGLTIIDIMPNALGDYYAYETYENKNQIGVVLNLGYQTTTVSIFNKGILTNTKILNMGAINIINDISFIYKIDMSTSKALYKDLVLASSKLSNPKEIEVVDNAFHEKVNINQRELSEICESRLTEILNLAKKQINILTKKEISYIIVTGGLSELKDFKLTLESVFAKSAIIGNLNYIGARDNSYASAIGIIKFFDKKILLRGKTFSIFSENELEEMNNMGNKIETNNSHSLLSKVFGYFFDS